MKHPFTIILFGVFCWVTQASATDELKAFPLAEPGSVRYVLSLPKQPQEDNLKVELIVGQNALVDTTIQGWGYTRYVVKQMGPMAGTLMAVDPNTPKQNRFVTLGGDPYLIRYNSRLPVVVYVPDGAEVRYRIWHADKTMQPMQQR